MPAKPKPPAKKPAPAKETAPAAAANPQSAIRNPQSKEVKIAAAKGRPMLQWVGKRPLRSVTAFPAQHVETFDPLGSGAPGGMLYHGDNKEVLAHLLANGFRGKVNLIYIDPPFDSGADYVRKVTLRGKSAIAKLEGDGYTLGEQVQYTDIWANDTYLQFMYERLILLKELLAEEGSLYVHVDARRCHHIRCLLDEVLGLDAMQNQISWKRTSAHAGTRGYGPVTDYLLYYVKNPAMARWNQTHQEITQEHKERHYRHEDSQGLYGLGELTAPGTRRGPSGEAWRGFNPKALGRHWAMVPSQLDELDKQELIYWPKTDGAWPRQKRYLADLRGRACTDFWDDIDPINMVGNERVNYPTQKPEALLERAIRA